MAAFGGKPSPRMTEKRHHNTAFECDNTRQRRRRPRLHSSFWFQVVLHFQQFSTNPFWIKIGFFSHLKREIVEIFILFLFSNASDDWECAFFTHLACNNTFKTSKKPYQFIWIRLYFIIFGADNDVSAIASTLQYETARRNASQQQNAS